MQNQIFSFRENKSEDGEKWLKNELTRIFELCSGIKYCLLHLENNEGFEDIVRDAPIERLTVTEPFQVNLESL